MTRVKESLEPNEVWRLDQLSLKHMDYLIIKKENTEKWMLGGQRTTIEIGRRSCSGARSVLDCTECHILTSSPL